MNQRSLPVTVEFLGNALDDVTCQRGFDSLIGRQQEMASIQPNQSVSLCFGNGPGSGAALAAVVSVLVEVPVMLLVCAFCNRTRHWFDEAQPGAA